MPGSKHPPGKLQVGHDPLTATAFLPLRLVGLKFHAAAMR